MKPCPKCGQPLVRDGKTPAGKQRWACYGASRGAERVFCYSTTNPDTPARDQAGRTRRPQKTPVFERTLGRTTQRFLITAAQNGTPPHKKFLASLELAAKHLGAELLIVPIRYKNPTSRWTASQENADVWHVPQEYLYNQRRRLNKHLILLGDVKTQPTASQPLIGFEAMTHGESGILAHTKLQLRVVPTPQNKYPKILTTTGACTVPNYTDTKTGKLGEFHHTLGAALVELRGSKFHLRQINADKQSGAFFDLDTYYSAEQEAPLVVPHPSAGLVMGDTHVKWVDPKVYEATWGEGGILEVLKPKVLVWHDLLDAYAVNPHHLGNPMIAAVKRRHGADNVEREVNQACEFVKNNTPGGVTSVLVPSNHGDMLTRWILRQDWRVDPENAEFYLKTALTMVQAAKLTATGAQYPDAFNSWAVKRIPDARVLDVNESCTIEGIECGMHGDRGPNGARGSIRNLRRIGVKSVIGHSHTPGIEEGCYQTGTSTRLRAEYTNGPSSWLNTHCVIYANGKRTLINIIDGEWRL